MHQRRQSIQAKRTISTFRQKSASQRRKESLRRTWSNDLPSLANHTVKLVVATLQIGSKMSSFDEKTNVDQRQSSPDDDDDDDDDDQDDILNIGQEVPAHIPDIVLNNLNDFIDRKGNISIPNEHTYENSTLLFVDVSGFTRLTEQYANEAQFGVDQLIRTLNSYFNKLVYEILIHKGDIYKFAGDAILALWGNDQSGPEQALKCALHLQQKCGAYPTDIGVTLKLKVALAYGCVRALFVGTEEFKHYLLTGDCVKNVNICEQLCQPEDIMITKTIYEKIQSAEFHCEFIPVDAELDSKQEHMLVKYSRSRQPSFDDDSGPEYDVDSSTFVDTRMDKTHQEITNDMTQDDKKQATENDLSTDELNQKLHSLMKSFLLRSVHQRIDREQSLYYLSELRYATISFINLDIAEDETMNKNLAELIQKLFLIINELTTKMGGVLNKALLFDKGWSFLCVFGLPGYKQDDDVANALKSAQMIHSTIQNQCKFVRQCSIGVTTGLTYCGVVGHKARCEYTVIGRKVNMAARLMCNYPNVISCDNETYYNSRLNSRCFQVLPNKTLKGMNNVGVIWQYDDDHYETCQTNEFNKIQMNRQANDIRQENYPILGRRVELMIVAAQIMLLEEPTTSSNQRRDFAAIIFEGDDKIGRSRLLQFIADSLENATNSNHISSISHYNNTYIPVNTNFDRTTTVLSTSTNDNESKPSLNIYSTDCTMMKKSSIKIINYRCQFEQRFNEFCLLRFLLKQLLQFHTDEQSQHEREQCILHLFDINQPHDLYLRRNLFLLNDLLDTRFRRSHLENENLNESNILKTYETSINELIMHILNKLIDPPDNIGEFYLSTTTTNPSNKLTSIYSQSHSPLGSTTSLTSYSSLSTVSKILFIIDDIHFADESSLKHLLIFGTHPKCLLILSMKPPRNNNNFDRSNSDILQSISTDSRVYLRRLPGLELRYLATLGCQILSVHRLPSKLIKVFNENCNGIPGFCEQILFDLLSKEKLSIVENDDSHDHDEDLIEGDADKLVTNLTMKNGLFKTFFSRQKQTITRDQRKNERAFSRICLLKNSADNDFSADCRQNFQNYIMCRIDGLSERDPIKIAAIIGNTFSRAFLWHLVDPASKKTMNIQSSILEMMQRSVIKCAYSPQQSTKTRSIKCYCLQNPAGFPSQCRLMAFTHASIREGICNSLPDSFKRLLTRGAIEYLEKHCQIACSTCRESKYDNPFLVHDQNDLAKIIKNQQQQQHAFVDIVKIAALKEIDLTIKELTRSSSSSIRSRSNTSRLFEESFSSPGTNRTDKTPYEDDTYKRGFSLMAVPETSNSEIFYESNYEDTSEMKASETNRQNSPKTSSNIQVNVQHSASTVSPLKPSQLPSLRRVSSHTQSQCVALDTNLLESIDEVVANNHSKEIKSVAEDQKKRKIPRTNSFITFVRYLFCQFVPNVSNATVTPIDESSSVEENSIPPPLPPSTPLPSPSPSSKNVQSDDAPPRRTSHWKKVRKAILPAHGKIQRTIPTEDELRQQSMFSIELMEKVSQDLQDLYKQHSLTRTFQILYEQSLIFYLFQSHVHHNYLIQYIYDTKQNPLAEPDLNEYVNQLSSYCDLRICECVDYVMTVYIKLVEYHTNLYDIYDKTTDDRHDHLCLKEFDRIMYYRIEICQLLLHCHCYQRLLVEIDNGRKCLEKLRKDIKDQDDFLYQYQCLIIKYTYNFFQARFLQHSRAINESKDLCQQCLKELNQSYEDKIWEKLIVDADAISLTEKKQEEMRKDNQDRELPRNSITSFSIITNIDQFVLSDGKYRLEYLLCQYHLLRYNLSRHESVESVNKLLELDYHTFPLSFSLSCTVQLAEYFYCQQDFLQCLSLIDKLIRFWWPFTHNHNRQRLEFAKLKCLSLIIELKQGSLESAIISGYFARRLLTGYHENTFLIELSIHLTLALIGEMRVSNINLILQQLQYLSEQTMNCYAKLWYYVLVLDVAMELGYEILPITIDLLDNIAKYRKKLAPKSHDTTLILVYSDCILAQIYARLGVLDNSKIHFHLALYHIKYDQIFLSHVDLCFKRSLSKLIEIQLLHWFHTKEDEKNITIDRFLINQFTEKDFVSWDKTRFFIYRAYYDRLVNDYRRQANFTIDNDFNWEACLREAEKHAIKLDLEWIQRLRKAWLHPVSEQLSMQGKSLVTVEPPRRSTVFPKHNRRFIRLSVPYVKLSTAQETSAEQSLTITTDEYSHQKFTNWRLFQNNQNLSQFHLYILPVRV